MNNQNLISKILDNGVALALATALLYICSQIYGYETARLYKYPTIFIETSTSDLVNFAQTMIGLLLIPLLVYCIIFYLFKHFLLISDTSILIYFLLNSMNIIWIILSPAEDLQSQGYYIFLMCFNPMFFLLIYVIKKGMLPGIDDPLQVVMKAVSWKQLNNFIIASALVVTLAGVSILAARINAKIKSDYFVIGKARDILIIGKSGEKLIGKPFSPKTGIISDKVIFVETNDSLTLQSLKISNLKFE
ncbi:hypothetical protein EOD41_10805 [Mucilaginibacter limnophilus]|uniref:Uncharacterized protein n=1 Tax=Mucilaginibacter limnophilus TaxID=1932778 RepID=A0A437MTU8_9SPHI|nr:hypothetical protein [Mucilaginibacter limnophilus]RVU01095.1 hypothetical protein EOD41_10805 [Mucilaginibacter limnophilus]